MILIIDILRWYIYRFFCREINYVAWCVCAGLLWLWERNDWCWVSSQSLRTFGLSSRNCVLTMNSTMDAKHLSHGESSTSRTLIRRSLERLDVREMASLNHTLLNSRFFRYCVEQYLGRKRKKKSTKSFFIIPSQFTWLISYFSLHPFIK